MLSIDLVRIAEMVYKHVSDRKSQDPQLVVNNNTNPVYPNILQIYTGPLMHQTYAFDNVYGCVIIGKTYLEDDGDVYDDIIGALTAIGEGRYICSSCEHEDRVWTFVHVDIEHKMESEYDVPGSDFDNIQVTIMGPYMGEGRLYFMPVKVKCRYFLKENRAEERVSITEVIRSMSSHSYKRVNLPSADGGEKKVAEFEIVDQDYFY